jgi:hypothetical protein
VIKNTLALTQIPKLKEIEKIKTYSLNLCSVIIVCTELCLNILWPAKTSYQTTGIKLVAGVPYVSKVLGENITFQEIKCVPTV